MDYGAIIKRSWQIMWRYKALWVLGVFAGVSGCQGGGSSGGGNSWRQSAGSDPFGPYQDLDLMAERMLTYLPLIIGTFVLLFLLGIVWWVLSVAARGGLIVGVSEIEEGRERRLGELWSAGFARFWSLLGLGLLLTLPVAVVGIGIGLAVALPLMQAAMAGSDFAPALLAPMCGALAIGIPLLIVLSFVLGVMYLIAQRYIMLGGQGAIEAAGNSWRFFRNRIKDTFLMYVINGALNIAAALVLVVPIVLIGIAVAIPLVISVDQGATGVLAGIVGVFVLVIAALSFFYAGIWGTFTSSLWTLFFREVTGMGAATAAFAPAGPAPYAGYEPPTYPVAPTYAPPASAYPVAPPAPPVAEPPLDGPPQDPASDA